MADSDRKIYLGYEADFDEAIARVMDRLELNPFSAELLVELRDLAIRRLAYGCPCKEVRKIHKKDEHELLLLYRKMAYNPLKLWPFLEIVRISRRLMPSLLRRDRELACSMEAWAIQEFNVLKQGGQ